MPRMRMIKPEFFLDEELADLKPLVRLLFIGLWTIADRSGRLLDRPRRIKAALLPWDNLDVEKALDDLAAGRFVVRYEAQGERYLQIRTFLRHQHPHIKEPASVLPDPALGDGPSEHGASMVPAPVSNGSSTSESESESESVTESDDPPSIPPQAGGGSSRLPPPKIPKRDRTPATLNEKLRVDRDRLRDDRSRALHSEIERRQHILASPQQRADYAEQKLQLPDPLDTRKAQIEWVQRKLKATAAEAEDVVDLVEDARSGATVPVRRAAKFEVRR